LKLIYKLVGTFIGVEIRYSSKYFIFFSYNNSMNNILSPEEVLVLRHLRLAGIDYATSISIHVKIPLQRLLPILDKLEQENFIEKAHGKSIKRSKAKFKLAKEVHKHHTYYKLSRKGRLILKNIRG